MRYRIKDSAGMVLGVYDGETEAAAIADAAEDHNVTKRGLTATVHQPSLGAEVGLTMQQNNPRAPAFKYDNGVDVSVHRVTRLELVTARQYNGGHGSIRLRVVQQGYGAAHQGESAPIELTLFHDEAGIVLDIGADTMPIVLNGPTREAIVNVAHVEPSQVLEDPGAYDVTLDEEACRPIELCGLELSLRPDANGVFEVPADVSPDLWCSQPELLKDVLTEAVLAAIVDAANTAIEASR